MSTSAQGGLFSGSVGRTRREEFKSMFRPYPWDHSKFDHYLHSSVFLPYWKKDFLNSCLLMLWEPWLQNCLLCVKLECCWHCLLLLSPTVGIFRPFKPRRLLFLFCFVLLAGKEGEPVTAFPRPIAQGNYTQADSVGQFHSPHGKAMAEKLGPN